jgi:hypothetical protein
MHMHMHMHMHMQVRAARADATHAPEPTAAPTAARRAPPTAPWEAYGPACLVVFALHAAAALLLLPLPWWGGGSPLACLVATSVDMCMQSHRVSQPCLRYCTGYPRVPPSCVPYVPEAQGSSPPGGGRGGLTVRAPYAYQPPACRMCRVPCGAPQALLVPQLPCNPM